MLVPPIRTLAIHPGALGDLIIALPAFQALRTDPAQGPLALLVGHELAGVAREFGLFDEVLTVDTAAAYRSGVWARAAAFTRAAHAARRWRPGRVVVFKAAPAWAALAAASGAAVRAGLTRGVGRRFLTHPVALDPVQHHADRYAAAVAAARVPAPVGGDAIPPGWKRVRAPELPAGRDGPRIGIAPGGARNAKQDTPTKRWAATGYAAVARRLLDDWPAARFTLLGAVSDRAEADVVRAVLPPAQTVDLLGRTTVAEAHAAIETLDLLLVNDSALLHVAGRTVTPTVAVFGPTDPRVLAPRGRHIRALWEPAHPRACWDERTGRKAPCTARCCISRVTVDQVTDAARAALGVTAGRRGEPSVPA